MVNTWAKNVFSSVWTNSNFLPSLLKSPTLWGGEDLIAYDYNSKCLAIIKYSYQVISAICYWPFPHHRRRFAEIVFFATNPTNTFISYCLSCSPSVPQALVLVSLAVATPTPSAQTQLRLLTQSSTFTLTLIKLIRLTRLVTRVARVITVGFVLMERMLIAKVNMFSTMQLSRLLTLP